MRLPDRCQTLAFRLALIYAVLFTLGAVVSTVVGYAMVMTQMKRYIDTDLLREGSDVVAQLTSSSPATIERIFNDEAKIMGINDCCYRLLSSNGTLLVSSDLSGWQHVRFPVLASQESGNGQPAFATISVSGTHKAARVMSQQISPDRVLQIAYSIEDALAFRSRFRMTSILVAIIMLVLGTVIGWQMGRRTAAGVKEMTRVANQFAQGQLGERVLIEGHGREIDGLARTLNAMAERIQTLLRETKESNDHIAHDLRSPIARIRATAEAAVVGPATAEEHVAAAGSIVEECDRLLLMVNTMLDIAETEAGVLKMRFAEMDVSEMARAGVDLFGPAAETKQITLRLKAPMSAVIRGDLQRCQRMLANVLDNAVKYTEPGGSVDVDIRASHGTVAISVRDTGCGIPPEALSRVFERFYRGDRSRHQSGNGLGLSLALSVARAHGGDITVVSTPGVGSAFTITLPTTQPFIAKM